MQRYHASSCTREVNNSAIGGTSARDTSRAESSSLASNFPLNSRRQIQVTPYKLRCEKETLNSRLGPADFQPPTPNCPEETITREYVHFGYRETVEGLEEAREISLSQVQTFAKPVILKCKEVYILNSVAREAICCPFSSQSTQSSSHPVVHTPADCVRAICRDRDLLKILGGHLGALSAEELAEAVAAAAASQHVDDDEGDQGDNDVPALD